MNIQKNDQKAQPKLLALFASDIHLHPALPSTTTAFFNFLKHYAWQAEQLYLLGDLFEYWAGDDDISNPYHQQVIDALRAVSDAGVRIFWIGGNRDFLIAEGFAHATGAELLPDPSTIHITNQSIVITHGDAQCTDDVSYMAFRTMVRQGQWQKDFLALPLSQRKTIIEGMRKESKSGQKEKTMLIMDVHPDAVSRLFLEHQASAIIHGHTHRPARHQHSEGMRYVLPDWDCDAAEQVPRGGWLAIYDNGEILFQHLDGSMSTSFVKE